MAAHLQWDLCLSPAVSLLDLTFDCTNVKTCTGCTLYINVER
ncbi:hypothetical protein RvY_14974 [Ramazzottius varieornatus]|uniref:Uncharacterized protein n=1 Tax=Ramazzottius varieornatus TaxID=947166 RepID=A0A1D1VT70_RAMVA|nr:hypothetical protein RvY_14974 [Ramazzottius varieornatus]